MACYFQLCLSWMLFARSVDLGLLLAVLAGMASAVVEARAEAAHAIMAWAAGSRGVPRASTTLYIAALHVRPRALVTQGSLHFTWGCFIGAFFMGLLPTGQTNHTRRVTYNSRRHAGHVKRH